jgi:hypothetical protein
MGWADYNDKIIPRVKQLAKSSVKTLFIYATFVDALANKYGLDHDWSEAQFNQAIPAAMRQIAVVNNGTEGTLHQNASLVAHIMSDFLGGWPKSQQLPGPV